MPIKYICLLIFAAGNLTVHSQLTISVSGKIIDEKSNGIAGASVSILNTQTGVLTGKQGEFEFKNIPGGNYILHISAIGFAEVNRQVNQQSSSNIEIVLTGAAVHLDEVIVSAQKREEQLQQSPLSITVFSSKKVDEYRLWNTKEMTALVPNLYAGHPGDNRNVTSVRGITSTSYDPAVATYIDGVNQFNLDTYIAQLYDVERIEVLRGPQGTLYGRNAMGGVINIITKKPLNHTTGFAGLSAGNYGRQRYSLGLRTPVIKNKVFAGASLLYDRMNGYYTNENDNSDFDKQRTISGNYYLSYNASPRLSFSVNAKHSNNRNNGAFPLVNGLQQAFDNPFKLNQNAVSPMIDNTLNVSLSANYTGRAFNFTSQTAWQTNHRYYKLPLDADFSPIDGVTIINNYGNKWNKVKVLTQEFRFSSPASLSSPWKWTTGVYLFHQSVPTKQATRFGNDADLVGAPDKNFSIINTSTGKSFGAALYGQVAWAITEKLELTGGLRYDHEHKKQTVSGQYQKDPDPDPLFATQADTTASASFKAFSPKLSMAWRFSKGSNGYITYSRGYRAGGFTQLSSDPSSQPPLFPFKPEYSNNYEAGVKSNLPGKRLYMAIAFFYTRVNDAQVPTLVLPDAVTITKNAGKLDTRGVELEIVSKPVKGLEIDYNAGYTHARYRTLKLSQNGAEQDFEGNKQVFTPAYTSTLAVQYSFNIGNRHNLQLVARGEWLALGEHYFDLANTLKQPSYSLFNTRFGLLTKSVDLLIWVRNAANKKYISYAYDFGAVHMGAPQTYGITLAGRF